MDFWIILLKSIGFLSIVVMFGAAFYIRNLSKRKDVRNDFMYSFGGSFRFYRDNWQEVKFPLFLVFLSILMLIFVAWTLGRLKTSSGLT